MLRRAAGNVAVSTTLMFWRVAISIALTPFLIRRLGADGYGVWILASTFSVTGYLSLFSQSLQGGLVKSVAELLALDRKQDVNTVFSVTLVAFAAGGVVLAAIIVLGSSIIMGTVFAIPPTLTRAATMLLSLVALQAVFEFPAMAFTGIIEACQRYDLLAFLDAVRSTLFAAGAVIVLASGPSLVRIGILSASLAAVLALADVMIAKHLVPDLRLQRPARGQATFRMLSTSGQLLLLRANALIYTQMDKTVLGIMLGPSALTVYDVVSRFHSLVLLVSGIVSGVLMPGAASLHALGERARLKRIFLVATKYSTAVSIPVTLLMMLFAKPLLVAWLGPSFAQHAALVDLALSYILVWSFAQVGWNILIGMDRAFSLVKIQLATTAVNLVVSILLTRSVGVAGVLWGTLAGNVLATVAYARLILPTLGVRLPDFLRSVLLPVYGSAIAMFGMMALVTSRLEPQSVFQVGSLMLFGFVVSLGLFVRIGTTSEERTWIRRSAMEAFGMIRVRVTGGAEQ